MKPTVLVPATDTVAAFRGTEFDQGVPKSLIRFALGEGPRKYMIQYAMNGVDKMIRRCVGLPASVTSREEERMRAADLVDEGVEVWYFESDGQAHTILQLIEQAGVSGPVLVVNPDVMMVSSRAIRNFVAAMSNVGTAESGALVFPQDDAASYSFVSEAGWFTRAVEKRRISSFAMVSVSWFADAGELARRLRTVVSSAKGEPRLADVFAFYSRNWAVVAPVGAVAEFGTPEKLRATIERFR